MRRKKVITLLPIMLIIFAIIGGVLIPKNNKTINIEKVLGSKYYSYLPEEAKDLVRETYNKTGELILTEKNKKENKPYLNPKYVLYLSLSNEEKTETNLIPSVYVIDFSPSDNYKELQLPETYNIGNIDNESYITPMKNQGNLGLCWSFATIEQAESFLMVRDKIPYNSSSQTFSVRQMDYATSNNGIRNYENENGYRALTSGGNFYMSSMIISNGLSLASDTYMPYNSDASKKDLIDVLNYSNSKYELNSTIMMPYLADTATNQSRDAFDNIVKGNVINYGGAYVGTGSPNGNCGFKNTDGTYAIVDSDDCVGTSGHAMQIIGWDDNYSYSYCKSGSNHISVNNSGTCSTGTLVNGTGAWILRNSWGDDTDMKIVYLAYKSYGLDIGFTTSLISANDKNWDNNYHKNLWVNGTSDKKSDTSIFYKKINTTEKIKKIKFLSASVDGEFSVSVKSGNNTYDKIKTVQVEYPGIYTIDFSNDNIILDDSQFSVTIESTNNSYFVENSISVFTSNVEKSPQISTNDMDGSNIKVNSDTNYEFIVYSSTKNIPSNAEVTYSLIKDNVDYSNYIVSTENNRVAENNINSTMVLNSSIPNGTYILRVSYNNNSFDSTLTIPSIHALSGEGTEASPYLIYTEDDLNQIRFNLEAYYLLKNDITLTENWNPIGTVGNPFRGGFDGGNHKIKGLNINHNSEDAVGFFGYVDAKYRYATQTPTWVEYNDPSYIKNITFENPTITNDGMAGVLIGKLTFNANNAPDTAINVGSPTITIENVHFIGGHVTSNASDAGVLAANLNIIPKGFNKPFIYMNNIFSSTTISGYHSAGFVGFINDSFESASGIMVEFNLKNFQNVGVIKQSIFDISYSDENNYSPVIGGIYGNARILLENFIINSIFDDPKYMAEFADSHSSLYVLGSYDKKTSKNFTYKLTNGYYVSAYFTPSSAIKDVDFSSKWSDFDDYWKVETIDGIKRIPVLKNINYSYKEMPDDITLKLYDESSLLQILNEPYQYISYNNVENDNIIDIKTIDTDGDRYDDDIIMTAKQKGQATIHVINQFDGIEKDITIKVVADKVDKPIITYCFDGNNSSSYTQQVNALESFKLIKNQFERAGFTFNGWNTVEDGSGISYEDEDTIALGIDENLRLYAQWTQKKYTLTFDANGGTGTMNDWSNIQLFENSSINIPKNNYTRTNYVFDGWNTKADGTGMAFADKGSISYAQLTSIDGVVMKLYAQWRLSKYNVQYILIFKGNIICDIDNVEFNYDEGKNLLDAYNNQTGYKFKYWGTEPDGTGINYLPKEKVKNITTEANIKLYTIYEPIQYKLILNSNNGNSNPKEQTLTYDLEETISKNTFIKEGHTFKEWNTKADGTGTPYSDEQSVINLSSTENDSVNLYAQWDINKYNITFHSNDGTDKVKNQSMEYKVNTALNENTFTRNEYTFIGWNTKADGTGTPYSDKQVINISKDLTLYAIWQEKFDYIINNYDVDETNKYISKIMINTEVNNFTSNIILGYGYGIDVDTKIINNKQLLYTGGKTRITHGLDLYREYTNIVIGDINGDGAINSADLLKIRQHLLRTNILSGAYFLSSDINYDNTINSADLLRVRQHLLGTKPIE